MVAFVSLIDAVCLLHLTYFNGHFKLSKFAPTTVYHGAFWLFSFIIMGLEICYFLHIQEFFTGTLITVFYRVCS